MKPIVYEDNSPVSVGDIVMYKKRFSKALKGRVTYVFQADKNLERETNDYGVSVKLDNGKEVWIDISPVKCLNLVESNTDIK